MKTTNPRFSRLTTIDGGRSKLVRAAIDAHCAGRIEELDELVRRLAPRGGLCVVTSRDDDSPHEALPHERESPT